MARRRILVLHKGSLLTQGVELLLRGRAELEVIGVTLDRAKALESVWGFNPHFVVADASELDPQTSGLLLRENPGAKIIYLSKTDAQVQVVSSQQTTVSNIKELLEVLEGG